MKKKLGVIAILIVSVLVISSFTPAYYIGGSDFLASGKALVRKIFAGFNNEAKLQDQTYAMIALIDQDFSKTQDYRLTMGEIGDLSSILSEKFKAQYYPGFKLEKLEKNCFAYKIPLEILQKESDTKVNIYARINLNDTKTCKKDCQVYFTEKGLLLSDDKYECK